MRMMASAAAATVRRGSATDPTRVMPEKLLVTVVGRLLLLIYCGWGDGERGLA